MENVSSLPLVDRDTLMHRVARELAMDLYPLDQILKNHSVTDEEFAVWRENKRFLQYYVEFKQEWGTATNAAERTRVKASVIMEEFMEQAYKDLHDTKQALNHRVELGKLVKSLAGLDAAKGGAAGAAGAGGFTLSINITNTERVSIKAEQAKVIDHDDFAEYDTSSIAAE